MYHIHTDIMHAGTQAGILSALRLEVQAELGGFDKLMFTDELVHVYFG